MKKLSEISIHIDLLPRLAAEAPPEEEKSPGKRTGKKKKVPSWGILEGLPGTAEG